MPQDAAAAQAALQAGNDRFVEGRAEHPRTAPDRRAELTEGQQPFAAILSCSDSRVPPEIVFDQGLGDLFVLRVAGNVVGDAVLGTLEFAVSVLGVKLVVVMGHSDCGAVTATVDQVSEKQDFSGRHVGRLTDLIEPAVRASRQPGRDWVDASIRHHARLAAGLVRSTAAGWVDGSQDHPTVLAAHYELAGGRVEWL